MSKYPAVKDPSLVGTYPGVVNAGGGYTWDEVLEYRVWCHPEQGANDLYKGDDYYYAFSSYEEALEFSNGAQGTEEPIALVLQKEYIDEPEADNYIHKKEQRLTEWDVNWLARPKRKENTIPDFFAPNAPSNRLDILRGLM
jgi:putative acetyltransferase